MPDQNTSASIGDEPSKQLSVHPSSRLVENKDTPSIIANDNFQNGRSQVEQIEKDIRAGERWLIRIGIISIIVNTIIALIYWGQLQQMRTATQAATKSADTAVATLREIQQGSTDTHALALAAKKQSEQAEEQVKGILRLATETKQVAVETKQVAAESKRAADISREMLTTSARTFRLEQRPWIMGVRFLLQNEPEENKEFSVAIYLTNTGKTPAIGVMPQSKLYSWPQEPPLAFPPTSGSIPSRAVITPGSTSSEFNSNPMVLNAVQLAAYKAKTHNIYAISRIFYTDIFNNQHWTTLCIFHIYGKPLDEWVYCEHGNDADHEQ